MLYPAGNAGLLLGGGVIVAYRLGDLGEVTGSLGRHDGGTGQGRADVHGRQLGPEHGEAVPGQRVAQVLEERRGPLVVEA